MPCSDLTVAVIHYQTPDLLGRCLARLLPAAPGARIVVIDAGDLAPLPPDWYSPGVELVRVANHSFAATVNAGLESCRTAYFAHMNADVLVERRTFTDLLGTLDADPAAGMAGPLPVDARGVLQDQGLPYRWWQWRAALDPSAWHHTTRRAGRSVRGVKAPWLSGCLQVVRTAAAHAAGPLDESQRFTNEETDWCHRMRDRGFDLILTDSPVTHLGGSSTPAHPAFLVEGLRGGMVVTLRHSAAWRAELQRLAVWGWASLASFLSPKQPVRRAAREVQRIFRERAWDEPVFGATLAEPLVPKAA